MDENEKFQKEIEFYSASVIAWFNTKLEYDKGLLTLSAGGIGLLVTLITTKGVSSITILILVSSSLISFLICLISVLSIFVKNSSHLEDIIHNNATNDPVLSILDKLSIISFLIAVILSCVLGISTAAEALKEREKKMSDEKKEQTVSQVQPLYESFNKASLLRPGADDLIRSFNGAGNLRVTPQSTDCGQQATNQQSQDNSSDKK